MAFFVLYNLTIDHLKAQHKVLAKQLHPDLGGNTEVFQEMQREYDDLLSRIENKTGNFAPAPAKPRVDPYKTYPRQQRRIDIHYPVIELLIHAQLFGRGVKLLLIDNETGDAFRVLMDEYVKPNDEINISGCTIRFVAASKEMTDNISPDNLVRYPTTGD
jgi:hypothetical protein